MVPDRLWLSQPGNAKLFSTPHPKLCFVTQGGGDPPTQMVPQGAKPC